MSALLLAPHHDDETLFACFLLLQHQPTVVTVLSDARVQDVYGVKAYKRDRETDRALSVLGAAHRWRPWPHSDVAPDWDAVRDSMQLLDRESEYVDVVIAPAVEEGGHEQHNRVGELALEIFGDRVIQYTTYSRHGGRTRGREVVPEPWMIPLKLRALSCYESQMLHDATRTRDWFLDGIREYTL